MEYPRACEAQITYTESGETELVRAGRREDALLYEITDMENAIASHTDKQHMIGASYMTMNNEFYNIVSEEIIQRVEAKSDQGCRIISKDLL